MGMKHLGDDGLKALNELTFPVWMFSCVTGKVLWANKTAKTYFGSSLLDPMQSKLPTDEGGKKLLARVRDEVEVNGMELVLQGNEKDQLPGVPRQSKASDASEFKYQQQLLTLPDSETIVCTKVQLQLPHQQSARLKASFKIPAGRSSSDGSKQRLHSLTMPEILDLVESLLAGDSVSRNQLECLHSMLAQGELVPLATRISEDLVDQEQLPQDVGLNLLQLLGSTSINAGSKWPNSDAVWAEPLDSLQVQSTASSANNPSVRMLRSPSSRSRRGSAGGVISEADDSEDPVQDISSLLPATDAVLATVDDWRFDAFRLTEATAGHPLSVLGFWLIKRTGLLEGLQLDAGALARFLRIVEDSYPDNPYHNKSHAADVLQSMHVVMTRGGLLRRMGDDPQLVLLAAYLAAVVHDNEHKGLNNDFLVRVSDDLALTYNDASPMENHHVAAAFRLMRRPGLNFLKKLSKDRLTRLRRLVIEMVLATDMKSHFKILSLFQAKLQVKLRGSGFQTASYHTGSHTDSGGSGNADTPIEDEADRSLVLQVALKCADVGHLAAPWDVHHRWVTCLEEEFFRQGDREKAAHLATSPLMDRCKDGITKSQVGFFDIVALPLFYSLATVFQDCQTLVKAVEDNCNRWRTVEAGRNAHGSR